MEQRNGKAKLFLDDLPAVPRSQPKKNRDYVRFGSTRQTAIGRFDTGPAAALAILLGADLVHVKGEA